MDIALVIQSIPSLLEGALVSLQIAIASCVFGLSFGTLLGIAYTSRKQWIRIPLACYVAVFRGTPMLVQIMFMYYVLPQAGIQISAEWSAILAIGCNSSAYISQIVRSGMNSVSIGQWEAAKVLGLTTWQTLCRIVLPQAFRVSLPSFGNEFITLVKDSSLASIIGVMELSKEGSVIRSRTYDAFTILILVSCIYLIMTLVLSLIVKILEKKSAKYVRT